MSAYSRSFASGLLVLSIEHTFLVAKPTQENELATERVPRSYAKRGGIPCCSPCTIIKSNSTRQRDRWSETLWLGVSPPWAKQLKRLRLGGEFSLPAAGEQRPGKTGASLPGTRGCGEPGTATAVGQRLLSPEPPPGPSSAPRRQHRGAVGGSSAPPFCLSVSRGSRCRARP